MTMIDDEDIEEIKMDETNQGLAMSRQEIKQNAPSHFNVGTLITTEIDFDGDDHALTSHGRR